MFRGKCNINSESGLINLLKALGNRLADILVHGTRCYLSDLGL